MLHEVVLGLVTLLYSFSIKMLPDALFIDQNELLVDTQYGRIRGWVSRTENNKLYYMFRGIPFALPPLGDLRFRPPVPPKRWPGVLNAIETKNICNQMEIGDEDCLYLNVYSPKLKNASLPVMVWIYGGAFLVGYATKSMFGPDYFLEDDVIIVTTNYRMGIFGFLSTEDEVSPGNYGLKDQILALKWVQKNIANFGGDPNKITLFGESAGSASTTYLMQTPLTKGLFHKAILQSGVSLSMFTHSRDPRKIAVSVARNLGIYSNDSKTIVEGLRKVNAKLLQHRSQKVNVVHNLFENVKNGFNFAPSIEQKVKGAVLTKKSHECLKNGQYNKMPILVGYNSEEGNVIADVLQIVKVHFIQYDLVPRRLLPGDMNIDEDLQTQNKIGLEIHKKFFGNKPILFSGATLGHFLTSDQFIRPITEYVKLVSQKSPTYFYVFSYEGRLGKPIRTKPGVGHQEDLHYLWNQNINGIIKPTKKDLLVRRRLIRLWTNFAKFSNPTPEQDPLLQNVLWPPSDPKNLTYLDIGSNLEIGYRPNDDDVMFWQKLYDKYGHPPYNTY